ncbi:MAG TPA: hypothetical protein VF469_36430 [Kofleriaceae bacterium]
MTTKTTSILACCVATGLVAAIAPATAHADDAAAPPAAANPHPGIGGHVGIATPLVFLNSDKTQTIGDQFNLAFPIGIGFKLTDKAAIDFETVVGNPIHSRGTTGLTVDPGIVYDMGTFVVGGRLGFDINAATNFKLIPLIHKAVAPVGAGANWFVEAAFPVTFSFSADAQGNNKTTAEVDIVFHTGIGF